MSAAKANQFLGNRVTLVGKIGCKYSGFLHCLNQDDGIIQLAHIHGKENSSASSCGLPVLTTYHTSEIRRLTIDFEEAEYGPSVIPNYQSDASGTFGGLNSIGHNSRSRDTSVMQNFFPSQLGSRQRLSDVIGVPDDTKNAIMSANVTNTDVDLTTFPLNTSVKEDEVTFTGEQDLSSRQNEAIVELRGECTDLLAQMEAANLQVKFHLEQLRDQMISQESVGVDTTGVVALVLEGETAQFDGSTIGNTAESDRSENTVTLEENKSSNDEAPEFEESRAKGAPKSTKKSFKRTNYTREEDELLLNIFIEKNWCNKTGRTSNFKWIAGNRNFGRTWDSMYHRIQKHILPNLSIFTMTAAVRSKLESERKKRNIAMPRKGSKLYTRAEDQTILDLIVQNNWYDRTGGLLIYRTIEKNESLDRSWSSLHTRFRDYILPNLSGYDLTSAQRNALLTKTRIK